MKTLLVSVLVFVAVTALQCQSTKTYVKIRKQNKNYASSESFTIKNGGTVLYQSPTLVNNQLYETEVCLTTATNDQYSLELKDSYGDGWTAGAWLELQGEYGNIFFRAMPLEDDVEAYTLSLYYGIKKNQEWKMTTNASGTWTEYNFADSTWDSVNLGSSSISPVSGTQYFRKTFGGLTNMAAFEVMLNYKCGIVAYINGQEIFRDNVDSGATTSATPASGCYSSTDFRGVIRPGDIVANAQSVLAVEIHYVSSGSNYVDFDAFLALYGNSLYNSNCYIVNDGLTTTASQGNYPTYFSDWSYTTYTSLSSFASKGPLYLTFSFSKAIPYVNGLRIWPYSYGNYAPGAFTFGGKNSGSTYTDIMNVSDVAYETKVDKVVKTFFTANLYKDYKMTITSTVSATQLRIYELHLMVCGVSNPSSITFEPNSYVKIAAYEVVNIQPTIREFSSCTINPALPTGLTLNAQTCTISGLSATTVPMTTYTVTSTMNGSTYQGTFSLQYVNCAGQVTDFYRTYRDNASYEYFEVIDEATQQVVYSEGAGTVQVNLNNIHHFVCLTGNKYTVNVHSTIAYWQSLSFLYVRGMFSFVQAQSSLNQYENIIRAKFDSNLGLPTSYTFYVQYQIPHSQSWSYIMGNVPDNWYNTDMSAWTQTASKGNYPASTNQIQLYKKQFSVTSLTGAAVVINLRYTYGCIIYLNGNEVFRNGVTGTLSTSSISTNSYSELRYRQISLPVKTFVKDGVASVNNIVSGQNTIAIALVAGSASQTTSDFDCALRVMGHNVQSRYLNDFSITGSGTSGTGVGSFAFHYYGNNYYSSSCSTNNYIDVKFSYDRREWISSLNVQLYYTQTTQYLRQFTLKARNPEDGDNWTTLKNVTGMTWSQAGQQRKIYVINNKPYNEYRFEGFGTGDPSNCAWKFSRIDILCDAQETVPELSYEHSSFSIFKDIEMGEEYVIGEYYMDFTINPALPEGVTIDPNTGVISGTAHTLSGSQVYTVTAKKYTGETTTATLTITVEVCTGGKSLITMVARTDSSPSTASYNLYQGKGTTGQLVSSITSFPIASALYYGDFCLNHGIYTLELRDTTTGWTNPAGYYLTIDLGEMKFEMGQVYNSPAPAIATTMFSSFLPFQIEYDDWKVYKSIDDVASNWNTVDFDDATWETLKAAALGTSEATTVYVRRTFAIPSLEDYHVLNIRVKYAGGIAAYFNGRLVGRFNLKDGFNSNTESLTLHDPTLFSKFHVVLNTAGANTNKNVMAFEIHRPNGQSSAEGIVFDATGIFGVNDCSVVVDSFSSIDGSAPSGVALEDLFDLTPVTFGYLPNSVDSYMEWTVENLEGSKFNSYGWQTVYARTKWGFSLYARMGEEDSYLTAIEVNNQSTKARSRSTFDAPLGIAGFSQFKYVIDATPSSYLSFSAHFFLYCKPTGTGLCEAIGDYAPVGEGQISPGPCDSGFTGYTYRECTGGVFSEVKTDKCEYKIPKNLQYSSDHLSFVLDTTVNTGAPTYDFIINKFYLHEGTFLPAGLTLDPTTGVISGVPTEEVDINTYTIYGENPKGATAVILQISVHKGSCKPEGNFPKTQVGEIAVYECSMAGSYIGTQKRACVLGAKDGEWQKIQGVCMPVVLIIIIVIVVLAIVAIVVFFISKTTRKAKAVGGVKGKKNAKVTKAPTKKNDKKTVKSVKV